MVSRINSTKNTRCRVNACPWVLAAVLGGVAWTGFAEAQKEATANLLANPGFEEIQGDELVGWKCRSGFEATVEVAGEPAVKPHASRCCLSVKPEKLTEGENKRAIVEALGVRKITVQPGAVFRYSLWVKGRLTAAGRNPSVGCIFYTHPQANPKDWEGQWTHGLKPTDDWQELAGQMIIKQDARQDLDVTFCVDIIGEGVVYLDDATIEKVSDGK